MKQKILLLLLFLTTALTACKKENFTTQLEGRWSYMGNIPSLYSAYFTLSISQDITFNGNTYYRRIGEKIIESGTFQLEKVKMVIDGEELDRKITFTTSTGSTLVAYYNITGEELKIYIGSKISDGVVQLFIKPLSSIK